VPPQQRPEAAVTPRDWIVTYANQFLARSSRQNETLLTRLVLPCAPCLRTYSLERSSCEQAVPWTLSMQMVLGLVHVPPGCRIKRTQRLAAALQRKNRSSSSTHAATYGRGIAPYLPPHRSVC
jgi:hypothetical protein